MSLFKLRLLILLVGLGCLEVSGQAAHTPFSAYGFGDTYGEALVHNQGMGGVGVSNPQYWYLNGLNPALLTSGRLTIFQAGLLIEKRRIADGTNKEKATDGNLNYLALGFPLLRNKNTGETRIGTAIGLMPYSNIAYKYNHTEVVPGSGGAEAIYFEQSNGGINEFYWSNGMRLNRYFSLGLKTSFLFGSVSTDFSNYLNDPDQFIKYVVNVHELQSIKGVKFMPGLHFRKDSINVKYTFNFGATAEFKTKIRSDLDQILERKDASGNILDSDTVDQLNNRSYLPQRFTFGASFGRMERWTIATDFSLLQPVGNYLILGLDQVAAANGWRWAAGAELTPDVRSMGNYLKRITYRGGISSEKGTYLINGNAVKDFGINFGLSLPVNRISSLDVAFRSGKRGGIGINGIEENYFKVYFGVTFNDQWFIKRRFD